MLAALGLGLTVFGVLRSAEWGWVVPKPGAPALLGISPTVLVVWLFVGRETCLEAQHRDPLVRPSMFGNRQMTGGLLMFFNLYPVQAALFFAIPLFLSVSLGLTALETGVRILPLSITRLGLLTMFAGVVVLLVAIDPAADARIVTVPLTNPAIPEQVKAQASVQLAGGVPFLSDADLQDALDRAAVDPSVTEAALDVNREGLQGGGAAFSAGLRALAPAGRVPSRPCSAGGPGTRGVGRPPATARRPRRRRRREGTPARRRR